MPISGGLVTTHSVVVPRNGVIIAAAKGTSAAAGLRRAVARRQVPVTLDDADWNKAQTIMDGKFQMVKSGIAQTTYPGWKYSWPWWCQGPRMGCVRTAVGQTRTQGWMIVVADPSGSGLTMPDFASVLAQLGVKNAMAFDSNTHADFWRRGATPITAGGGEPPVPATTLLRYR
jgi:hypothetical protein